MSDKALHWVHVLALSTGHHQVVLRLIEQLYNKQGIWGWLWGGGGTRSRLCNRGWHSLKHFTIIPPL